MRRRPLDWVNWGDLAERVLIGSLWICAMVVIWSITGVVLGIVIRLMVEGVTS